MRVVWPCPAVGAGIRGTPVKPRRRRAHGHAGDAERGFVAISGKAMERGQRSPWALSSLIEGVGRRGIDAVACDGTPLLCPATNRSCHARSVRITVVPSLRGLQPRGRGGGSDGLRVV